MHEPEEKRSAAGYPVGRGYGNDYMRGGEVFGGYGYSARPEYARRRGDRDGDMPSFLSREEEQERPPS